MQPVGNRGRSMNRLARQLPAAAREHTISQCQTNASRMMIGMGIPSSQSKIPRPIAVLLREMREGQFAPTQLKGPGVADRAPPPSPGIRFRIDQALASIPTQLDSASCVTPSRAAIVAITRALQLAARQRVENSASGDGLRHSAAPALGVVAFGTERQRRLVQPAGDAALGAPGHIGGADLGRGFDAVQRIADPDRRPSSKKLCRPAFISLSCRRFSTFEAQRAHHRLDLVGLGEWERGTFFSRCR